MTKKYDLIVVGAGPAGLTAAKSAAQRGLDVALLDRKKDIITIKRGCGQGLSRLGTPYLGESLDFDFTNGDIVFPNHGFRLKYSGPYRKMNATCLGSTGGHIIELGGKKEEFEMKDEDCIGVFFDKSNFLKGLLDEAAASGVNVFPGVNVIGTENIRGGVKVIGDGISLEGSFAIGADGVNSRLAERLGFNRERERYGMIKVGGYYMQGVQPHNDRAVYFIYGGPFILVIFPTVHETRYIVVIVTFDMRRDVLEAFEFYTKKSFYAPWFSNAKKLGSFSAVANMYSQIREPFRDQVLLISDAAACEEVALQGSMIMGWIAAREIYSALENRKTGTGGLPGYLNWWKKVYLEQYNPATYMMVWALPIILDEDEINYLFALCSRRTLPATYNSYDIITHLNMFIEKSIPIIQLERPEIIAKLQRYTTTPLKEIWSENACS